MNWLDILAAAYVAFSAARGRKRGLPDEAYRCLRLFTGLAAGCGLFTVVSHAVSSVTNVASHVSAPVAFVATFGGAYTLMRAVRRKLVEAMEARFASLRATGGAAAGAVRALIVVVSLATAVQLSSSKPDGSVAAGSLIGRIASTFTPAR